MPVVSNRTSLRDHVVSGNDGDFAEVVRIEHWSGGRTDPARPTIEIVAKLEAHGRMDHSLAGDRSKTFTSQIRTGGATLKIDRTAYPNLELRENDVVVATGRPGQPKWRVASVDVRHFERLIVNLGDSA